MIRPGGIVKLWPAHHIEVSSEFENAVATCLASAFSSGLWASSPMPIGDSADRQSARGVISEFGKNVRVLAASETDAAQPLLGCVLGGLLDEALIGAYRLAAYGAQKGDGLLAYIGVLPSAQGSRVIRMRDNAFKVLSEQTSQRAEPDSDSLAGLLFSEWLRLYGINACPRVFVRTRKMIRPVLHLIKKNGFEYLGHFELDFYGDIQDRLVFSRNFMAKTQISFGT
jgi:hypothetical protein